LGYLGAAEEDAGTDFVAGRRGEAAGIERCVAKVIYMGDSEKGRRREWSCFGSSHDVDNSRVGDLRR
jgi:hypothetical protein